MKKILCALMAAVMMLLTAGAALAGVGDQVILRLSEDSSLSGWMENVIVSGDRVYFFVSGLGLTLYVYNLSDGTTETWSMQEMQERMLGIYTGEEADAQAEKSAEEAQPGVTVTENVACWFPMNGELYGVLNRTTRSEWESELDGGHVRKMVLADGKASLAAEDTVQLDWSIMTERVGSSVSSRTIFASAVTGNILNLLSFEESGNISLVCYDLTTGTGKEQMIEDANDIAPSGDGRLLVSRYSYGMDGSGQVITLFDPETEAQEDLLRVDMSEGVITSFAWDPESDTVYFSRGGELFAAPGRDLSQAKAVNDSPSSGKTFSTLMGDGRLLMTSYDSAYLRNTDPALRSEICLRIRPYAWGDGMDAAMSVFSARRSDVSVVQEDYGDETTLLSAMMNRDSRVDVYIMNLESTTFGALFDRGFLLDLSGDAKLTGAVEEMYPFVQNAVMKDGKLLAVPLGLGGEVLGYDSQIMEKLGITEADLPGSWDQLFSFLDELPDRLAGTEFRAFPLYVTREDVESAMLDQLMNQYTLASPDAPLNTPEMRHLLEAIREIRYDELGVLTVEDLQRAEEDGRYEELGGMKKALMTNYCEVGVSYYWGDYDPLKLAMEDGGEMCLPATITVAFVNPYSEHPQEAMEFLETLVENISQSSRYSFNPNLNEPIRYANHEEQKQNLEKLCEIAKQNLEKAEEEDREQWEKVLADYEEELKNYDEQNWMLSPRAIAQYRTRADAVKLMKWNYYQAISSTDGGNQIWELRSGYLDGSVSAPELLSFIDKKVQMMRLEGN